MWQDNDWKPITAEQASKIHPKGKVSAISGLFRCRLCNQFVTLSKDGYFKHSRGDEDKRCPERAIGLNTTFHSIDKPDTLPIRLQIMSPTCFALEIGLILLPKAESDTKKIKIIPLGFPNKNFIYDLSRLSSEKITYLSVRNMISSEYRLCNEDGTPNDFLPDKIQGIHAKGTLFHGTTLKRLPDGADVTAQVDYYLLTSKNIFETSDSDIVIQLESHQNEWYIYKIRALKYNRDTAEFFLRHGYVLTQKPVSVIPVWPEYIHKPYIIHHLQDSVTFFLEGQQVKPELFPNTRVKIYSETEQHMIFDVICLSRQQLLSASRNGFQILKYTYLWKSELNQSQEIPEISITDIYQNSLIDSELPADKIIQIRGNFDGFVKILDSQRVIEKYNLSAGNILEIDNLKRGYTIQIFQGLDCVKSITFQKKASIKKISDKEEILHLLQQHHGKMIPVPHHLGAVTVSLQTYPKIKQWLYQRIRQGFINEKAYKYLVKLIKEIQT